jgi:hypothetical protein
VGSYGKQLGTIGDVLRVLLDHVKLDKLTLKEKKAVDALREQLDAVDEVKAQPTHAGTNEDTVLSSVP